MKWIQGIKNKGMMSLLLTMTATLSHAGIPLWTFTPLTPTTIAVPANGIATVKYQVTNQSKKSHTLVMNGIPGVTQITKGSGVCGNPFRLSGHNSCTLTLQINGNQIASGNTNGPVVCEYRSTNQCYKPAAINVLKVIASGNQYSLGGTISGLSGTVYLQNNGLNPQAFGSNGSFTLRTGLPNGTPYDVTVQSQPSGQLCSVSNGTGTINGANVTNLNVTCSANSYTVGGTISGLSGTVVLLNNGGDADTVSSNGSFTFATPIADNGSYNVTVGVQPVGQTCSVTNGSGIISGSNVSNVGITCAANTTTLSMNSSLALSVTGFTEYGISGTPSSGLPRLITLTNTGGLTAVNLAVTPPTTWPSGTTSSTTCGSTLAPSSSCTITITPGNTATSDGSNPCSTGATSPVPHTVQVSADNANTVSTDVVILSYGCNYQGGYVYAFDDTTPNTGSVGGKVAATTDQALAYPNGIVWSSNGGAGGGVGGLDLVDVSEDILPGLDETSTTSVGSPSYAQFSVFFSTEYFNPNPFTPASFSMCNGVSDGSCNTNNIVTFYNQFITNNTERNGGTPPFTASAGPTNITYYAAGLCKQTIASYSDWYLPAICELGYDAFSSGSGCGTSGAPTLQNMQSSLVDFNALNLLTDNYWSSTEESSVPQVAAWQQIFAPSGNGLQGTNAKFFRFGVRCSRALTL